MQSLGERQTWKNKRKKKTGLQRRKVFKNENLNKNDMIYPRNFTICQGDSKIMLLNQDNIVNELPI